MDKFWLVYNVNGNAGSNMPKKHETLEEAKKDASEKAGKHYGQVFAILEATLSFETARPAVVETQIC